MLKGPLIFDSHKLLLHRKYVHRWSTCGRYEAAHEKRTKTLTTFSCHGRR
jgi:hypothetical protein